MVVKELEFDFEDSFKLYFKFFKGICWIEVLHKKGERIKCKIKWRGIIKTEKSNLTSQSFCRFDTKYGNNHEVIEKWLCFT